MTVKEEAPLHTSIPGLSGIGLEELVKARQALHLEKVRVEKELKEYNTILLDFLNQCQAPRVSVNGALVQVVSSSNSRIDKKELLNRGVDPEVISESTKVKEYSFIKVTTS